MTDLFVDPRDEFLSQDPHIRFLAQSDFTPKEQDQIQELSKPSHTVAKASLALGGLFLLYRLYISRKLRESSARDLQTLKDVAATSWQAFAPWWVGMASAQLMAGYAQGVVAAQAGTVDQELLYDIAQGYAAQLGENINEVSRESLVLGYQSQINRKVPAVIAARRVGDAFGVPPKTMNSLVSVWTREEGKQLHAQVVFSIKDRQASVIIESATQQRAVQIGANELFSAQHQAKQLMWMYGIEHGTLPSTATRMWVTAKDERVCTACGPMDRSEAPVTEQFPTDQGDVWAPPLHPSCRCDIILHFNIADTLSELTDDVSKAQGSDPYDRDKTGRFAASETRPKSKPVRNALMVDDPFIKNLERQLADYLESKRHPQPEAKPQFSRMAYSSTDDDQGETSAVTSSSSSASPYSRMNFSQMNYSSTDSSSPSKSSMKHSQVAYSNLLSSVIDGSYSESLPDTSGFSISTVNQDDGSPSTWDPLPRGIKLMKFYAPENLPGGVVVLTKNDLLRLNDVTGDLEIGKEIGVHWDDYIKLYMDENVQESNVSFNTGDLDENIRDEDFDGNQKAGVEWDVSPDLIEKILREIINADLGNAESELMGVDANGDLVHNTFSHDDISNYMGLKADVFQNLPVVIVISHGTNTTSLFEGRQSYARNPGTYRVYREQHRREKDGLYEQYYLEPTDYQ